MAMRLDIGGKAERVIARALFGELGVTRFQRLDDPEMLRQRGRGAVLAADRELAIAAHVQLEVRSPRTNLALPHSGDDHNVAAHVGAVATGNDPAYADADPDADPDAGAQICAEPFSTCAAGSGLRSRKHSGTIPLPSFFLRKGRSAGSKEQIAGARAAGRPAPPEAQIVPSQREQQPRPTPELSAASIFVGPDGPVVRWDESSIENSAKRTGKFRLPPKR